MKKIKISEIEELVTLNDYCFEAQKLIILLKKGGNTKENIKIYNDLKNKFCDKALEIIKKI